ncbi:MAG: hypothetical protein J6Y78_11970, partial [Paludibacteraceae bacterium]|nr:hypothetical protein [Paludibacteraceae bacterium]
MKKHIILVLLSLMGGSLFAQSLDKQESELVKKQVIAEWKAQMSAIYDQAYQEHIIRRDGLQLGLGYFIRGA